MNCHNQHCLLPCGTLFALLAILQWLPAAANPLPNIILILCDDLGYGDVQCLNPEHGKIPTPGADRLAREGMIFTDAHSGSSVCTPTRYGIMTGRYSWRTKLQAGVVTGYAPSLIAPDRPTVAGFLKAAGYHTAAIGKWHLNFQYLDPDTGNPLQAGKFKNPPVGAKIPDGPAARGFDLYHGFHHARDMEAVIENDTVIEHDAVVNMLPRLRRKAVEYIHSRKDSGQPFFLYLPLGSPHTPIVPSPEWIGRSGLGKYGDFVMQTDDALAAVMEALESAGLADKTLLIYTSDNGCSKEAGIEKLAAKGHKVSAGLRGSKADIWDGGHRVPFIARWPSVIQPGSVSNELICLVDFFATAAEIVASPPPANSCEDSVSFLPALKGQPAKSSRGGVIHHSISGHFAYRQGPWKLALARGSGGWTQPTEAKTPKNAPPAQLYHMERDIGETANLFESKPDIADKLLRHLESDITRGRSTDGPAAANDVPNIILWKSGSPPPGG
jgi:arylsulfatase A